MLSGFYFPESLHSILYLAHMILIVSGNVDCRSPGTGLSYPEVESDSMSFPVVSFIVASRVFTMMSNRVVNAM